MEGKKVIFYIVVFLVLLCVVYLPGFFKLRDLRKENKDLQKRITLLEEHNEVLKEEIASMQEDPGYVEKKAREKLGVLKKGEIIYKPASER
ncbi:MAG: septum formation initiator family protein [Candidatus Omnitrophota bacterium]|jgi:cell division protein FtsB